MIINWNFFYYKIQAILSSSHKSKRHKKFGIKSAKLSDLITIRPIGKHNCKHTNKN